MDFYREPGKLRTGKEHAAEHDFRAGSANGVFSKRRSVVLSGWPP